MAQKKGKKGKKGKRKVHPSMKAYSSCVSELKLNPRKLSKKTKEGRKNIKRLKACAAKKLARAKR